VNGGALITGVVAAGGGYAWLQVLNRAIAERLYVSERTVENHLYRSFAKLGVSSRAQLAELVGPEAG